MLQRQQAQRRGGTNENRLSAVGMVQMALNIGRDNVVELDTNAAAMVSNLLAVLCSDRDTQRS